MPDAAAQRNAEQTQALWTHSHAEEMLKNWRLEGLEGNGASSLFQGYCFPC